MASSIHMPQWLRRRIGGSRWVAVLVATVGLGSSVACAQTVLVDPEGASGDLFGVSISVSDQWLHAGAMWDDTLAGPDRGSVLAFERVAEHWVFRQRLEAPESVEGDYFGNAVAFDGDTVLVGAYHTTIEGEVSQGAAHIFVRDGSSWTHLQRLLVADGQADDYAGASVAIEGDTAVVCARYDDNGSVLDQGSASIFKRGASGQWKQTQKLVAPEGAMHDSFGFHCAISEGILAIGANWDDLPGAVDQGSVHIFAPDAAGMYQHVQRVTATDGEGHQEFGIRVALSGSVLAVGAPGSTVDGLSACGAVYIFSRSTSGVWTQRAKIVAPDRAAFDQFASGLSLAPGVLAVGAWAADMPDRPDCGRLYSVRRALDGSWTRFDSWSADAATPAGAAGAFLGTAVATLPGRLIGGAYSAPVSGSLERGCVADFAGVRGEDLNGDGTISGADLGEMLARWGSTEPTCADIDFSGTVDGRDLALMLAAWQ